MPTRSRHKRQRALAGSPFLTRVGLHADRVVAGQYPFAIPALQDLALDLDTPVTFLVGENGSGKSTLIEALAWAAGFGAQGGSRDHTFAESTDGHALGRALRLAWRQKVADGFYLRAETFFNFAAQLEALESPFGRYGGTPLNARSHGEAFLALFEHRFEDGLYLLDEPEAALSPQRQLAFIRIIHTLAASGAAQFVIATHSPMLLTVPGAKVLSLDGGAIRRVAYEETDHFRLTRDFLAAPERFYRHLLADSGEDR
jgi:predicted ATPase